MLVKKSEEKSQIIDCPALLKTPITPDVEGTVPRSLSAGGVLRAEEA